MVKNIEMYPLLSGEPLPERRQLEIAEGVKRFVYNDTLRVGASEAEARSVADPSDKGEVRDQLRAMIHPPVKGIQYLGVYADEEWRGVVKLGPWLRGDEALFRSPPSKSERIRARLADAIRPAEQTPQGLHVFAVREGLANAALSEIYHNLLSPQQALKAAVHENDAELHAAFTDLGAPEAGPVGQKQIGDYLAAYVLRILPPRAES